MTPLPGKQQPASQHVLCQVRLAVLQGHTQCKAGVGQIQRICSTILAVMTALQMSLVVTVAGVPTATTCT